MLSWWLILFLSPLVLFVYWLLKSAFMRIPHPDGIYVVPRERFLDRILGQIVTLLSEEGGVPHKRWFDAARKQNLSVIGFEWWRGTNAVMPCDPEDLAYLLHGEGAKHVVKHKDYKRLERFLGYWGLVPMRDEAEHTVIRKKVSPAFAPSVLDSIANNIVPRHGATLNKELSKACSESSSSSSSSSDGGAVISPTKFFDKFTLSVITEAAFKELQISTEDSSGKKTDIAASFSHVNRLIGLSFTDILPSWIATNKYLCPTEKNLYLDDYVLQMRQAGSICTERCRTNTNSAENVTGKLALLDLLVKDESLTQEQLSDILLATAAAGQETTATALLWTTFHLSRNPKIQDELYEELRDVCGLNVVPNHDDLVDCDLLSRVVRESLRLSPPVPMVGREATADIRLPVSKIVIPRGMRVSICIYLMHHHPDIWGETVEEFLPDRWLDNPELKKKSQCAFMPFLVGKRDCIGSGFAMRELLVGVALIVRSFQLEWPQDEPLPRKSWRITMRPKSDLKVKFTPRKE